MKLSLIYSVPIITLASLLVYSQEAQAGHNCSGSCTKTGYKKVRIVETTTIYQKPVIDYSYKSGDYCLHEPGGTYGLSYGNGCKYDGGYGAAWQDYGDSYGGGVGIVIENHGIISVPKKHHVKKHHRPVKHH